MLQTSMETSRHGDIYPVALNEAKPGAESPMLRIVNAAMAGCVAASRKSHQWKEHLELAVSALTTCRITHEQLY